MPAGRRLTEQRLHDDTGTTANALQCNRDGSYSGLTDAINLRLARELLTQLRRGCLSGQRDGYGRFAA